MSAQQTVKFAQFYQNKIVYLFEISRLFFYMRLFFIIHNKNTNNTYKAQKYKENKESLANRTSILYFDLALFV